METIEILGRAPGDCAARNFKADPDMEAGRNRRIAPFRAVPGVSSSRSGASRAAVPRSISTISWTIRPDGGRAAARDVPWRRCTILGPGTSVLFGSGEGARLLQTLDDAPLMYRSVVVPIRPVQRRRSPNPHIIRRRVPTRRRPRAFTRFKSVVRLREREAAFSIVTMDQLYAFARTDYA